MFVYVSWGLSGKRGEGEEIYRVLFNLIDIIKYQFFFFIGYIFNCDFIVFYGSGIYYFIKQMQCCYYFFKIKKYIKCYRNVKYYYEDFINI